MTPRRHGFTLLELLLLLGILSIVLATAGPPLRGVRDRWAVVAARDRLATEIERTRALAIAHGGARLRLDIASARCWPEDDAGAVLAEAVQLGDEGVGIEVTGAATAVVALEFDALGLGRLANRTIRLRRGVETGTVTVSAFGRVRTS